MSDLSTVLSGFLGGPSEAYTRTLAQLKLSVQQTGAWENSDDITGDVLKQAVNYAIMRGYDIMVQRWEDYYTTSNTFTITAGVDTYPLQVVAPYFYKLRHLDVSGDGVRYVPCYPHSLDVSSRWSGGSQSNDIRRVRYRIQGASLVFVGVPGAGFGRSYYIPTAPQLALDTDSVTFDVPAEEMLIIHLAARDMLLRSDLDPAPMDKLIVEDIAGLRTAADSRDAGEPFYLDPAGPSGGYPDDDCEGWY